MTIALLFRGIDILVGLAGGALRAKAVRDKLRDVIERPGDPTAEDFAALEAISDEHLQRVQDAKAAKRPTV